MKKEKASITNMPVKGAKPGSANKKAVIGKAPKVMKKGGSMNKKGC